MESIGIAILRIIHSRGSEASTTQIYASLERGDFFELQKHHWQETIYGGRPAYQHEVRSYLSNMVQSGEIVRLSRGVYAITEKGEKQIAV